MRFQIQDPSLFIFGLVRISFPWHRGSVLWHHHPGDLGQQEEAESPG